MLCATLSHSEFAVVGRRVCGALVLRANEIPMARYDQPRAHHPALALLAWRVVAIASSIMASTSSVGMSENLLCASAIV